MMALIVLDREVWHWYSTDDDELDALTLEITELRRDIMSLEREIDAAPDAEDLGRVRTLERRIDRVTDAALLGYLAIYARSQNLGSAAAEGLYTRCRAWVSGGSGTFVSECQ